MDCMFEFHCRRYCFTGMLLWQVHSPMNRPLQLASLPSNHRGRKSGDHNQKGQDHPQMSMIHFFHLVKSSRIFRGWHVNWWLGLTDPNLSGSPIQHCSLCFILNERVLWYGEAGPGHSQLLVHQPCAGSNFISCGLCCTVSESELLSYYNYYFYNTNVLQPGEDVETLLQLVAHQIVKCVPREWRWMMSGVAMSL